MKIMYNAGKDEAVAKFVQCFFLFLFHFSVLRYQNEIAFKFCHIALCFFRFYSLYVRAQCESVYWN